MTQWLTPDERAAWVRLAAVLERLPGLLETQLNRDADLTHFEYWVLAMLSESPERTLRMTQLAGLTSATLPRLSHVVKRLDERGLLKRMPCPDDRRATNVRLTAAGLRKLVAAAPGHVNVVREYFVDALTADQLDQATAIFTAILERIGPDAVHAVEELAPAGSSTT